MWKRPFASLTIVALSIAPIGMAAGCAINPATGKRQLVLVSEQQEVRLGRENDQAISAELGLYGDEALQGYVRRIGNDLAARSERPDLEWTFRVVDDPVVNAFALPGGYIYMTRGILAFLENEAELASVLGHEIGHVTARHGVNQLSKAQIAEFGLGLGRVLAPESMSQFGDVLDLGAGLLFLKFSRDDERQADDLGLRYLESAGYDTRPMAGVFDMLGSVSAAEGGGRVPPLLSTHPAPENRRERMMAAIAAGGGNPTGRPVRETEYLAAIDNIVFGEDPREGYFVDNSFFHPEMKFRLDFPAGWTLQNRKDSVIGVSAEKDAILVLTLAGESGPGEAAEAFFAQQGVTRTASWSPSVHGHPVAAGEFAATTDRGTLRGLVAFVGLDGRVFRLLGYGGEAEWSSRRGAIADAVATFDRLTDPAALRVEPKRLKVVRAPTSMTIESFHKRHGATVSVETLRLLNRLEPGESLEANRSYKVVTGGRGS